MQKLLVSVRGATEALEAVSGGAHIADVEIPSSALGTPYPLNILSVRETLDKKGHKKIPVSSNVGEQQAVRATACQAALGVATSGADIVKCGLAGLQFEAACYLGDSLVRSVKKFHPRKKVIPAVFVDESLQMFFRPFDEGLHLVLKTGADGLLIDTFDKTSGRGLLDHCTLADIRRFAKESRKRGKEAWIAGSISAEELPDLWATGVDVICVRRAACEPTGPGRHGAVRKEIVQRLVATMPG